MKRFLRKTIYGIHWGFYYALIAIPLAALMSVLSKTHPSLALLFVGVFSLLNFFLSRRKVTAFFAANTLFLPFIYPLMFADYVGEIGSNMWQILVGELIVVSWISGIIYIILAMIARFVSLATYRRFFPPYLIGALLILLGVSLSIRLGYDYGYAPISKAQNYTPLISLMIGLFVSFFVRILAKPQSFFHRTFLLYGFLFSVGATFAYEAIAVELGAIYFLDTSVYYPLTMNLSFSFAAVPLLQNAAYYFNYLDNLFFSTDLILFVLPLTVITFSKLFEDISKQRQSDAKTTLENDIDEILLSNGLSLMVSNLAGASFVTSINHHEVKVKRGYRFISLLVLLLLSALFGLSDFFNQLIYLIPLPIYGGLAMSLSLLLIVYGVNMWKQACEDNPGKKNTLVFALTLLAGLPLLWLDFHEYVTTERVFSLTIGSVHLNYLISAMIIGLCFNLLLRRKKRIGKDARIT